jgi:hypothetical protein
MTYASNSRRLALNAMQEVHSARRALPKNTTIPPGSVLLGVLRSIERELNRREMIGFKKGHITPLWFLAETERNIFLWRNGRSLDDHRDFTFWVNIPGLITKRRYQLDHPESGNPFINPLWGHAPLDETLLDDERDYLDTLEELSASIFRQAEALSLASEAVRQELEQNAPARAVVVLPG